jgi:hypothetical protein
MPILLSILGGMIAIFGVIFLIALFVQWFETRQTWSTKIPYREFKVRYGLDPYKWTLKDGYAEFCYKGHCYYVRFGFFDYIRYELFSIHLDKEAEKKKQLEKRKQLDEVFNEVDRDKELSKKDA